MNNSNISSLTWRFSHGSDSVSSDCAALLTSASGVVVGGGRVYFRGAPWGSIPCLSYGDTFMLNGVGAWSVTGKEQVYAVQLSHLVTVVIGPAEQGEGSPENPLTASPPKQTWARTPKSDNISVEYFATKVTATDHYPGIAFYRQAITATAGCKFFWEFLIDGAVGDTLGGFGVAPCSVNTFDRPGVGTNVGCLLYYETGAYHVANSGVITELGAAALPMRLGVAVEVMSTSSCHVSFWVGGEQVGATQTLNFEGTVLVPTVCTLSSTGIFYIEDFA